MFSYSSPHHVLTFGKLYLVLLQYHVVICFIHLKQRDLSTRCSTILYCDKFDFDIFVLFLSIKLRFGANIFQRNKNILQKHYLRITNC